MFFPGVGPVKVKWFFVDDKTPPLSVPTCYNSTNWLTDKDRPTTTPGEIYGAARPWSDGRKPALGCTKPKGSAAAWAGELSPLIQCNPTPTARGGIELWGKWHHFFSDSFSGSGGVSLNGSGVFARRFSGSGGVVMNGSGSYRRSWTASGGLAMNGSGSFSRSWAATGGLLLNGSGSYRRSWPGSGGVMLNGSTSFSRSWEGIGGITLNGSGTFSNYPGDDVPTGAIYWFGNATPPAGHLVCDGSAVSRTTYSGLFAVIGGTFGVGDGSTTFNLPDLRGRSPVGAGTGSGLTPRSLGVTGGEESHVLTTAELAAHTHGLGNAMILNGGMVALASGVMMPPSYSTSGTSGSAGSGNAHNTMHPFIGLTPIIKT